jgi:hypothetical protein
MRWSQLKIVLLCTLASVIYGVVHDQVTIRVCPEYFVVAHRPLCTGHSLTVIGLCWGVAGTWWIGAALGIVLARMARPATGAKISTGQLASEIGKLLVIMGLASAFAGAAGWWLGSTLRAPRALSGEIPSPRAFWAASFAHGASYLAGLLGGGLLIRKIWSQSGKRSELRMVPDSIAGWGRVVFLFAVLAVATWKTFW